MSAAEDMRGGPGRQEIAPQAPKLELVKPPESLDAQIEKLTQRHRGLETSVAQMRQILGEYLVEGLFDSSDQEEEKEQKALLESDIEAASKDWEAVGRELAVLRERQLNERKELSSAWDEAPEEGIPGVRAYDVWRQPSPSEARPVSTEGDVFADVHTQIGNPWARAAANEVISAEGERTQETAIPREELQRRLAEKEAELERARGELEKLSYQSRDQRKALESQAADIENRRAQAATDREYLGKVKPVYRFPLLRLDLTNEQLMTLDRDPLSVKKAREESAAMELELKSGPPKRGLFKAIGDLLNGAPSWEERKKALELQVNYIDDAIQEYGRVRGAAIGKLQAFDAKVQGLDQERAALESDANPAYVKYAETYAAEEAAAARVSELYEAVQKLKSVTKE